MRIRSIKPEFRASGVLSSDASIWRRDLGTSAPGEEFLYRFYDREMRLLYVGITWNPFDRWKYHRKSKPWWGEVHSFDLYNCSDDQSARYWETWCIKNLDPKYNKHQNPRWHRAAH